MARRSFFRGFPGFRLPPPLPTATATPPLQSLPCLQLLTEFSKNKQIVLRLFQGLREFCIYFNFASEKHNQHSLVFLPRCATHFYPTAPPHVLSSRGLGGFRWWTGTLWLGAFLHRRGRFRRQRLGL